MIYIETEIKIQTSDLVALLKKLKKLNAVFKPPMFQSTTRLDSVNMSLEEKGIFLRVRIDKRNTITLKEKIEGSKDVRQRKETEFEIEDASKMIYILQKLGFSYLRTMEKYRMNISFKDTEISIDEMPFGIYVEIEGNKASIKDAIKELGLIQEKRILETYWELHEEINRMNKTHKRSIVFPKEYKSQLLEIVKQNKI